MHQFSIFSCLRRFNAIALVKVVAAHIIMYLEMNQNHCNTLLDR